MLTIVLINGGYLASSSTALASSSVSPNLLPFNTWYTLGSDSATLTTAFVQNAKIKCVVTDTKSNTATSSIITVTVSSTSSSVEKEQTAVAKISTAQEVELPTSYAVEQNYPNPFNPSTVINYQLPKDGLVSLKVYDILGREVRTLVNEIKSPGKYSVSFNASNLASGIYFYRLQANDYTCIKKMILTK
jgi:hypothetical protein